MQNVVCTWLGSKTISPFVGKEESIHMIRMLGYDTTEMGYFSVLFSKKCTDNMCIFYSPFYSHLAGLIRPLQKTKSSKRIKEDDKNLLTARLLMTIRKKLKNSRIIMINVINILVWWLITMVTMVKKLWCEILILMNKILPIKRRGIMVTFSWEL